MSYLKRISPAMVMATVAVILALSGGAYAATQVANKSIGTKQLMDSAVTNHKLLNGAVGPAKLDRTLTAELAKHNGIGATGGRGSAGATGPKGDTGPAGKDGNNGADGSTGAHGVNGANPGVSVVNVPAIAPGDTSAAGNPDSGPLGDQGFYFSGNGPGGSAQITNGELDLQGPGVDGNTGQGGIGIAHAYSNVALGSLDALSYDWHVNAVDGTQAPTIHVTVTGASADSKFVTGTGFTNLVYNPAINGVTASESTAFQSDAFAPGAKWYSSAEATNSPTTPGSQDDPEPLSYFVSHDPSAVIGQVSLDNGGTSGGTGTFDAGADSLIIGFQGSPFTRYDFGN
jgi:hypothetical protein